MRKCTRCGAWLDAGEQCDCGGASENVTVKQKERYNNSAVTGSRYRKMTRGEREYHLAGLRR